MVDALVGILILTIVSLSVSASFSTLGALDRMQAARVDSLVKESDANSHSAWY